jgi:CRISPR-associated protein Csb2
VKLTERFRDAVVRQRCLQVTRGRTHRYAELTAAERDALALIRGLAGDGGRVEGRATVFFALTPDAQGLPTRLVCWRESAFSDDEIDALLAAAEQPFHWEYGSDDWRVRLVPLPFSVPRPAEYWGPGRVWETATPFLLPAGRRRWRHGRQRPGETPQACLRKLLGRFGFPEPEVEAIAEGPVWVTIHESPGERRRRSQQRGTRMRPGHRFRVTFPSPVSGPLCVGHSCHFGLGLFRRVE